MSLHSFCVSGEPYTKPLSLGSKEVGRKSGEQNTVPTLVNLPPSIRGNLNNYNSLSTGETSLRRTTSSHSVQEAPFSPSLLMTDLML